MRSVQGRAQSPRRAVRVPAPGFFVATSLDKRRAAVPYDLIDKVELGKGRWKGEPSVRIACTNQLRRLVVRPRRLNVALSRWL